MLAILKTGGKQYKVKPGDILKIEKLEAKEGDTVTFNEVLFLDNEKDLKVGTPYVEGAVIEAKVLGEVRSEKTVTIKHKPKKRYLKKQGYRQTLTKVKITKVA